MNSGLTERLLSIPGDDDPRALATKVQAFRIILLMVVTAETLPAAVYLVQNSPRLGPLFAAAMVAFSISVVWALFRPFARLPTLASFLTMLAIFTLASFPDIGNHQWLQWLCLGLLSFADLRVAGQQKLVLQTARWMAVIVFFYTGLQKVLYGLYFKGQFLSYVIATEGRFSGFFGLVLPRAEVERLGKLGGLAPGAGPYEFHSPMAIALSNATMIAEMIVPLLLLFRRTRFVGAIAAIVLLVNIEMGARELMFGVTFLNMLALFFVKSINRWLVLPAALLLAGLLIVRFFINPDWYFA